MDLKQVFAYADLYNFENKRESNSRSEMDAVKAAEVA